MKPEDLNAAQLHALAEAHVEHFERLLDPARTNARSVRRDECMMYLTLWQNVYARSHRPGLPPAPVQLTPEEYAEVSDAIDCGDYDALLEEHDPNAPDFKGA